MIPPGTRLSGYEVEAIISQGGMATVYRARRLRDGHVAAVKVLREQYAADQEFVERFQREARAVASLTHPNMVQVYESGEAGGVHFIAMEFVEGQDLKRYLREHGPLPPAEVVRIATQVCEVLDYAHRRGIIHRDIKPQNILLRHDGTVKVTDFGIARALSAVTITQTGTVLGSVQYLSPEQARGQTVGRAADIYALSVVLFEMLTGELPFAGDSPIAIAMAHVHDTPPYPRRLNPEIPSALEAVVLKGLAKQPLRRYASAADLASDLLGQTSLWSDTPPADEAATRVVRRGALGARARVGSVPWLAPVLAVLVVGVIAGGVWGAWRSVSAYFNVAEVEVPRLVGLPQAEAQARAAQSGLSLNVQTTAYSETVPVDAVVAQDQPVGKRVKSGRVINVVLSLGKEMVSVPDLVGQTLLQARLIIEGARLRIGRLDERFDDTVKSGLVVSQDPPPGSRLARGSAVTLLVSRGPELVEMPLLVGRPLEVARRRLEGLGLIVRQVRSAISSDLPAGTVVDQSPAPNRKVRPSETEVILTVSVPPGTEGRPPEAPVVTVERRATPTPGATPGGARGQDRARGQLRTVVHVVVPEGEGGQRIRVVVIDEAGVRTVYERDHAPGEKVDVVVQSRGYTIIQVYLNSTLIQEIRP